jgi:subtilisin family serine protease
MASKAIITRRGGAGLESADGVLTLNENVQVEQALPQGTLVRGAATDLSALERAGFRVKLLTDTNILEVGAYRLDTETLGRGEGLEAGAGADGPQADVPADLEVPSSLAATWPHHLVQLAAPPTAEWVASIQALGVEVVEPISAYGLFVVGTPDQVARLRALPFVEWVAPFKPAYRLAPGLGERTGKLRYLNVGVYPASEADAVRAALIKAGATLIGESEQPSPYGASFYSFVVELNAGKVEAIARLPMVRWIEFQGVDTLTDERSAQIVAENLDGAAAPATAPVIGYQAALATLGLSGDGVTIGIVDSGVDTNAGAGMHADLAGRFAFFVDASGGVTTVDRDGHGTHVAGIAVGNGATGDTDPQGFLLGQGMAPGARFGSINPIGTGGPFMIDNDRVRHVVNNGGQVSNNSWGVTNGAGSGYTARSLTYDQRVRDPNVDAAGLEYVVIVAAAGNDGPNPNTIGAPWEAKNPIVVGNSLNFRPLEGSADDIRGVSTSSGRGPTVDGRILPNVVAPGTDIISARANTDLDPVAPGVQRPRPTYVDTGGLAHQDHTRLSGTSMASPHVAGLTALVIEWWRNRTGGDDPSPALVKALLINGAEDLVGGPSGRFMGQTSIPLTNIPNGDQGWGRVSLENMVLQAPASDRGPKIFSDQRHAFDANGQEFAIRVAPADPARPLRITLAWTDAAGAVNANPALVNDLDLEVLEEGTGDIFRGNVFANGFSTTGGAFDNRNNVECVYLQNPSGIYQVTVIAASLPASARPDLPAPWQDFALVIDNAEVPAAAPVSVVPLIDCSGSMVAAGYVDVTRTSSQQFVDLLGIDDRLAVASFATAANVEFPTGPMPSPQTITGQAVRDAAKAEIQGIGFGGCTFMGAGIETAGDLLAGAVGGRAIVMLSDGYDNKGCDAGNPAKPSALEAVAALPAGLPVHTCAMGPASDQALLEQIADASNGRYYYMPSIDDLFEIYNYIRGQVTGDGIIVNDSGMASSSSKAGFIDALATEATFTVAWADSKLRYVPGAPRRATDVGVRLRDPKGKLLPSHDSALRRIVGRGYVAFRLSEPMAGRWQVEVSTAGDTHVRYTVGGFVRSPIRLALGFKPRIAAGTALHLAAQVLHDRTPVSSFKALAQVRRPTLGIPGLLAKHRTKLRGLQPPALAGGDLLPLDVGKLLTLRAQLLDAGEPDLFVHQDQALRLQAAGQSRDTKEPGSYNVRVTVEGTVPGRSTTRFVRQELASVLVR